MSGDKTTAGKGHIEPVPRKRLAQAVLERLLERISGGEYPPGSMLPSERQLMETFQVGRPAVREALQDLERMGIIVITHGERARVIAPTARSVINQITTTAQHLLQTDPEHLDHLKAARQFFEVGVARLAASRATPEDIARLQACIDDLESADTPEQAVEADIAFHKGIAAVVGNPIFIAVSEAMLEWLMHYHTGVIRADYRVNITIQEHRAILQAMAAHDVEGAGANMLTHLSRSADLFAQDEE